VFAKTSFAPAQALFTQLSASLSRNVRIERNQPYGPLFYYILDVGTVVTGALLTPYLAPVLTMIVVAGNDVNRHLQGSQEFEKTLIFSHTPLVNAIACDDDQIRA